MNRKIFALFALTAGMHLAVHASENVNTPENRQFLKQQENLSRQLREKPDHQLKAWAEKQVLEKQLFLMVFVLLCMGNQVVLIENRICFVVILQKRM